ncbi:MAG: DUF2784 domain-containing protein [Alkalispirochaeta sp.]
MRALLADIVLIIHGAYIAFVLGGWIAIVWGGLRRRGWVRNPWFRYAHLTAIGIVVALSLLRLPCPLTVWERNLRIAAGQSASDLAFIPRILQRMIFFEAPPHVFTVAYAVFGAVVLVSLIVIPPRRK